MKTRSDGTFFNSKIDQSHFSRRYRVNKPLTFLHKTANVAWVICSEGKKYNPASVLQVKTNELYCFKMHSVLSSSNLSSVNKIRFSPSSQNYEKYHYYLK